MCSVNLWQELNKQMKKLYIIRGVPGSGKSTFAKTLGVPYYEADMYFEQGGEYKYDKELIHHAHKWCSRKVREAMEAGIDVASCNTFTRRREMKGLVESAVELGYKVVIVDCRHNFKNVHAVPDDKVEIMRNRWQEIPEDWDVEIVRIP